MADIRTEMYDAIKEHIENEVNLEDYSSKYDLEQSLYDDLFVSDSVTGNASGSYYCNSWKAKESVLENTDILLDAVNEFFDDYATVGKMFLNEEWESLDVTMRCYLLGGIIADVLEDMEEEINKFYEENER